MSMHPPRKDHGFIYIFSNPAMPGLHKVGLTTNPIQQRLQQLNSSTSVPSRFKLERLFEVETQFLQPIEQIAHRKLRDRGVHCGKEFFRADLKTCVNVVQDVIYELTGSISRDLVGDAQERAAEEAAREEADRSEKAERERELILLNDQVRKQREEWISDVKRRRNPPPTTVRKFIDNISVLIGIPVLLFFAVAIFAVAGPLGILVAALIVWGVMSLDNKSVHEDEARLQREAQERYPFKTLEYLTSSSAERQPVRRSEEKRGSPASRMPRVILEKTDRAIHGRSEISGSPSKNGPVKKWRYSVSEDVLQHVPSGRTFRGNSFFFDPLGVSGFVIRDKELPFAKTTDVEFYRAPASSRLASDLSIEPRSSHVKTEKTVPTSGLQRRAGKSGQDASNLEQPRNDVEADSAYQYVFVKGARVKRLKAPKREGTEVGNEFHR